MKPIFAATVFVLASAPAFAADVGMTVSVGQPGFYGQISIGNAPAPEIINAQPVVVEPAPVAQQPIYLHVPPGDERDWRRHCREYNACGRPVYFVNDRWYNKTYAPHYREHREEYRAHEEREHRGEYDRRGEYEHREGGGRDERRGEDRGR